MRAAVPMIWRTIGTSAVASWAIFNTAETPKSAGACDLCGTSDVDIAERAGKRVRGQPAVFPENPNPALPRLQRPGQRPTHRADSSFSRQIVGRCSG